MSGRRAGWLRAGFVALLALHCVCASALAAPAGAQLAPPRGAPLKDELGFPEFRDLVKQKVGEVRGLKGFWNASGAYVEQTTFTGGSFRGLLLWLHDQLQDHAPGTCSTRNFSASRSRTAARASIGSPPTRGGSPIR